MRKLIALAIAGGLLALAPAAGWADSTAAQELERLMIQNADTPAEHKALADYYRKKAAEAKAVATMHQNMGKSYGTRGKVTYGKIKAAKDMKQHCDRLAELNESIAAQYEELAKGEDAAAM